MKLRARFKRHSNRPQAALRPVEVRTMTSWSRSGDVDKFSVILSEANPPPSWKDERASSLEMTREEMTRLRDEMTEILERHPPLVSPKEIFQEWLAGQGKRG